MRFTVFLSGFLLLLFVPDLTESINIKTLGRIIHFFEQNYKRVDGNGHPRQYAIAINVPIEQCQKKFKPTHDNFLTQENAENVKNVINDETNALYQGAELIAAGIKKVVISKKKQYYMHSESLMLNPAGNSPMTQLMNRRRDGCSVFYTFDSPCVDSCLNMKQPHNIINGLRSWASRLDGVKAFVFKNIWKFDIHKDLQGNFSQIADLVPLYRCVSENECYACRDEGNMAINARCLH